MKRKRKLLLKATPEELKQKFYNLNSRADIANLLEISEQHLNYYLYRAKNYRTFRIRKKDRSFRVISCPNPSLKLLQRKLNQVLQAVYADFGRRSAHGFLPEKSILTNARQHYGRNYVLNLDLEDFFPSINFGRLKGMFEARPYSRNGEVATILAQLCVLPGSKGKLPQGAPTSPIISNMICITLDKDLQNLAKETQSTYTRYADDITFSCTKRKFPPELATPDKEGGVELSESLQEIIKNNGFTIKKDKIRLRDRSQRQEVTGLVVNEFPNVPRKLVRQVRAMLHAYAKFGLEKASAEFVKKYYKNRYKVFSGVLTVNPKQLFLQVLAGKLEYIGSVKGHKNKVFTELVAKLETCNPTLARRFLLPTLVPASTETTSESTTPDITKLRKLSRYAILVGVTHYDDSDEYSELTFCAKDVDNLRETLITRGYELERVTTLTSRDVQKRPTSQNIRNTLHTIANQTKPEDTLLFYYSGHGDLEDNESYLVTKNGEGGNLKETGLALSEVRAILEQAAAKVKIIILDSCFSGSEARIKGKKKPTKNYFERVFFEAEGIVIITSCKDDEFSWKKSRESSVFTYYLIEALKGIADTDKKGFVTVTDVNKYVTAKVKEWIELEKKS